MTTVTKAKLRAMPRPEVEQRLLRAQERGHRRAFWRYYFELTLRQLEARAAQ